MRPGRRQLGSALIVAMLVTALIGGISTKMVGEHLLDIKYQRNYLDDEQSYFYLLAGENLARRLMFEDLLRDEIRVQEIGAPKRFRWRDNLCEDWTRPLRYPLDGGHIEVSIEDLNRRFNINTMIVDQRLQYSGDFPYTVAQRRFVRLLQTFDDLDIDEQQAVEIAAAVYDWMDSDSIPEAFGGMEDSEYSGEGLFYHPSNSGMASISELRLIPRIEERLYRRLKDHITVWPAAGRLPYRFNFFVTNLNTATPNVLRAIPEGRGLQPLLPEEIASTRAVQRQTWSISSEVNDAPGLSAREDALNSTPACGFHDFAHYSQFYPAGVANTRIGFASHQMLVTTRVTLGGTTRTMQSVMHRIKLKGLVLVWARAFGTL